MANLSSKEITALEEQLSAERMLVAKYRGMASQCSDAVIKNKLDTIASRHQQHFDRILTFLN
ncbi:MAG: spore coat protein [Clostridiaceae bacterium]|nr:spore coat protein [Clostridiales bacterium]MDD6877412.1 spore coat protein [Clostridiaceae bacterium]MDY3072019.1 spore coat protein [Eubacteriales bacterium]MDY3287132.1 spore coat protein [Eubacteriales bacterium]MDY5016482.1 spore coat protein [Eubacteriales bacterium]